MMGPVEEIELAGGGINRVVRIGDAVHRPSAPWSRATCELLNVLHAAGLPVPAWRGADEQGREVLDYLPGEVGHYPLSEAVRTDAALVSAARLLRRFHDISVSLVTRDLPWQLPALADAEHGDARGGDQEGHGGRESAAGSKPPGAASTRSDFT